MKRNMETTLLLRVYTVLGLEFGVLWGRVLFGSFQKGGPKCIPIFPETLNPNETSALFCM